MTKQEFAEAALRRWQCTLGLEHWDIQLITVDAPTVQSEEDGEPTLAEGTSDWPTLTSRMTVAFGNGREETERSIRHECLHCLVADLVAAAYKPLSSMSSEARHVAQDNIEDAHERLVRMLERAFDRVIAKSG